MQQTAKFRRKDEVVIIMRKRGGAKAIESGKTTCKKCLWDRLNEVGQVTTVQRRTNEEKETCEKGGNSEQNCQKRLRWKQRDSK